MPDPAVLRGARAADLPAILDLTCQAFGEDVRPRMFNMLYGDSTLKLKDLRLVEVGGVIASCVRIADRPIWYGGAVLRMGGIGAVSTLPTYRGRGLSSAVLEDAIGVMRARGYQLSLLFTGIQPFYARLGWVPFPEHAFHCPVESQPPDPPDEGVYAVHPFDLARDLPAVERLYDLANRGGIGPAVRSHRSWLDGHARILGVLPALVARRGDEVAAYASFRPAGTVLRLTEAGCAPEAVAAYGPLASSIVREARAGGMTVIEGHLPRGHGLLAALQELSDAPIEGRLPQNMMVRVIDLQGLLRAALPALRRRLRVLERTVGDCSLGLRVAREYVRIGIERGQLDLDVGPAARVLDLPADLFVRLFLGDRPLALLQEELALRGVTLHAGERSLLAALFPPQDAVYWSADHF